MKLRLKEAKHLSQGNNSAAEPCFRPCQSDSRAHIFNH